MKPTNQKIKLSIIVPVYKAERYLPRCLESLLAQTLPEIEIICVNDGSPDRCPAILKEYQEKAGGQRFVIIDKQNEGPWKARRDGIAAANGQYIGFLDADDYLKNDFAKKMYRAAKASKADIVCCGFDRIDEETEKSYSREMTHFPYQSFHFQEDPGLMEEVNPALWNKIYRADLLKNAGDLPVHPKVLDDFMFMQLIIMRAEKIAFLRESLISYRVRSGSVTNTMKAEYIPDVYKSIKEIRQIYDEENPALLTYLEAAAFLHLGISLMYRLSEAPHFKKILKENMAFLNAEFPGWRRNPYMSLSYVLRHRGANMKLHIVHRLYCLGLFRLFLTVYRGITERLAIDIKW